MKLEKENLETIEHFKHLQRSATFY